MSKNSAVISYSKCFVFDPEIPYLVFIDSNRHFNRQALTLYKVMRGSSKPYNGHILMKWALKYLYYSNRSIEKVSFLSFPIPFYSHSSFLIRECRTASRIYSHMCAHDHIFLLYSIIWYNLKTWNALGFSVYSSRESIWIKHLWSFCARKRG